MAERDRFHAYRGSAPPRFANDAERECARILDFHGVPWQYEPHTFDLEVDGEGRVIEAFTPDFYLPEQRLYLEITTMKQALVTKKNRKLRRLRELHPELRVKLFYRRDVEALALKFGADMPRSA
jgi:hypoxanthine phosphoribosyltransferase